MHQNHCCESSARVTPVAVTPADRSLFARWRAIAKWVAPAGGLILLPKCPACLAAYIVLATGVGISVSAATYLRAVLLTLCIASIAYLGARRGRVLLLALSARHRSENGR
jgi:hypothetical protein